VDRKEQSRLRRLLAYERQAWSEGFIQVAGVDEAGRGPLAGPVFAAACHIPKGVLFTGIDDSKQLTPQAREDLFARIVDTIGVVYGIASVSPETIDQVNIYQATLLAMKGAIDLLATEPDCLLVDGMPLKYKEIPAFKIIRGDAKSQSIAAASILAKVSRDRLMDTYDAMWPQYGFKRHKGYGTPEHLKAIATHGPCPIHRLTFAPLKTLATY